MSLFISQTRKSQMAMRNHEENPIATFVDYARSAVITSNRGVLTGGDLINAANGGTYDYWLPDTASVSTVQCNADLGAVRLVNFIGIAAHNLTGATVSVSHSANGVDYIEIVEDAPVSGGANAGIYFEDTEARYWRVEIAFSLGASFYVGVLQISEAITFPVRTYQGYTPPLQATEVDLQSNVTEGGNFIGSAIVRQGKAASIGLNYLSPVFVRGDDFQAFQSWFNAGKPFFWAWRPTKYQDLLYAWRSGGTLVPTNSGPNDLMSFEIAVRAYNDAA